MSGPLGVIAIILLEGAVGGAVVLWATGVWGVVRRGFFLLTGITVALCATGAWAVTRGEIDPQATGGDQALTSLAVFAGLAILWQVVLLFGQNRVTQALGIASALAGVVALALFGLLRTDSVALGLLELALGALFLGSALYGLLLGHWYLIERKLTNVYMIRGAGWYVAGVVAAAAAAGLSTLNPAPGIASGFSPFLSVPGFSALLAGGLVAVCALIAGFVWRLAKEGGRSIQAATGYFYLAVIMAFSAELSAKLRFF
jgi:hypothetical protein